MSDENLNQPTGTNGPAVLNDSDGDGDGGSFGINDFFKDAAAAPRIENPVFAPDNARDRDNPEKVGDDDQPSNAKPLPTPTDPSGGKRTIKEIQAHRSALAKSRKFDGLEEDEISLFKSMSKEAYDRLYPAYLKAREHEKTIEKLIESSKALENRRWYEEPEAYQLHPEYREAKQASDNLQVEEEFWQEQLARIKKGEDWYDLVRTKEGEYRYGNTGNKPSPESEAQIISNLTKVAQYKMQAGAEVNRLKESFAGRYKAFNEGLSTVDKEMFGTLDMEKIPQVKQDYAEWMNKLPKEFQGQLVYQMLAKSAAVIKGLTRVLRSNEVSGTRKQAIKTTVVNGGPSAGVAGGGNGSTKDAAHYDKVFGDMAGRRL